MLYCRSRERRISIFEQYKLTPVAHVKLLNGQERKSCTNDLLTDSYYCFAYESKSKNLRGEFLCGNVAAKDFFELIKEKKPPLFNPLVTQEMTSKAVVKGQRDYFNESWNEATRQLYNAINLLVIYFDENIGGPMKDISCKLLNNKNQSPLAMNIKSINTIIEKRSRGKKLQQMISELRVDNPNLREFKFDLLYDIFYEKNSYKEIKLHFE